MRKVITLIIVLAIGIGTTLVLLSPKTTPSINADGTASIAEVLDLEINGATQRILIRGQDLDNPLLLHVHGGPGGPDQAILSAVKFDIEDLFTVVYWDQRGAGASYHADAPVEDLSLAQIVADGITLSEYLLGRFEKDRLYLQGHSWGTLVSTHMATRRPNLYVAYFGIGHIANSKRAEKLSYSYTLEKATQAGDQKTVDKLAEIGGPPYASREEWNQTVAIERALMQPYEKPDGSLFMSMFDIYRTFTFYRGYSITDKLNSLSGSAVSLEKLWMEAIDADLISTHRRFEIPVYFFQGKYDQHTVTKVAKEYFELIEAPQKAYFEFSESAHWPHVDEFERYRNLVEGLLP